jgi:hypothetical protein
MPSKKRNQTGGNSLGIVLDDLSAFSWRDNSKLFGQMFLLEDGATDLSPKRSKFRYGLYLGKISSSLGVDRPSHISELLKVVEIVPMEMTETAQG